METAGPSRASGAQIAGQETFPRKESSVFDVTGSRRKEVLAAKSVVDEVRRRVGQLRGGQSRADREKEEKEKEEKLEKARAAAWAWYQHGKGGKESISSSSNLPAGIGASSTLPPRSGELGHKSSRFKTEALRSSGNFSSPSFSQPILESDHSRRALSSTRMQTDSGRSWDFSNVPLHVSRTSSLFDSYELDSLSKCIDTAFQGDGSSALPSSTTEITAMSRSSFDNVPQVEVRHREITRAAGGLPAPMRPQGASSSAPSSVPRVISVPPQQQVLTPGSSKVTRSSSMRMQFPRCICSSISDVVTHEEMTVGADIKKCNCPKHQGGDGSSGWSLRRITRAIQELIHLPEVEYHPQQEHHERRNARLHLHHHHHHHHRHDHEYHHHLHYQIKLRDGVHHGNSFTTHPGKPNPNPSPVEATKEKDRLSVPRLSTNKSSPKVSPKLY